MTMAREAPADRSPTTLRAALIAFGTITALTIAAASPAAAQYPRQLAIAVDGEMESAEWLGLDPAGKLVFAGDPKADGADAEELSVAPLDLVVWGHPVEFGRGSHVVFVDGGVLSVETVSSDAEQLHCSSPVLGPRTFPLPQVRGVVFSTSGSRAARARLFTAVSASTHGDRDRLVTASDDEMTGTVTTIDFRCVTMQTSLGPIVMELSKAAYLVFNPALAASPPSEPELRMLVGLRDGSLLVCSNVTEDADRVGLKLLSTPKSPDAQPSWDVGRSEVVFLQTFGGAARYLSDLTPEGYRHVPYLDREWSFEFDRSLEAGPLTVAGKRYIKGVAMHSTSRLSFPIGPGKKRFAASLAIDDETHGRGSVTFRVFVDKEERYKSDLIRGGRPPVPINVDVSGGAVLSLIVDFGDHGDEQDHAVWLNARLLP